MSSPTTQSPSPLMPKTQETMTEEQRSLHLPFMREALAMAELALNTNETPVGCVIVHNNTIIARGMNATNRSYNGTRHAEFVALSSLLSGSQAPPQAAETLDPASCVMSVAAESIGCEGAGRMEGEKKQYSPAILKRCDLYVTVEPCIMCASLLRQVGIRKVYFGAVNEKFGGTGGVLSIQRANGRVGCADGMVDEGDYEVSGGWLRDEAVGMLQRFYMQENGRAPEPRARGKKVVEREVEGAMGIVEGSMAGDG